MKTQLLKITALSLIASSVIYAGGYKIPETSLNGTALSAANVAHTTSADAAYYNPANMAFMADENAIEMDLMYIGLNATNFKGSALGAPNLDIDAESETFLIPSLNYVSPKVGDFRFGFSMVVPGGLTKRWEAQPAKAVAEEFTLQVVELNPTAAYKINDKLSVALGLRLTHSEGIVKSSSPTTASRDLEGESYDFGYNLALSYRPLEALEVGLTYRSQIDLSEEGNAKLKVQDATAYDGGASVEVPLPAFLNLAIAYTFETKTTVEFVYERNFWSAYETLDFEYNDKIPNVLIGPMDDPRAKDWVDTNAFRIGVTQELDKFTLMAGMVIDETPVPDETVSFELPDSDSISVSFGGRYQYNEDWNFGLGMLYSMREERTANTDEIDGDFSDSNLFILSVGVGYTF